MTQKYISDLLGPHRRAHIGWLIFVLSGLLVVNISFDFGANARIADILNFAVGFTSFIIGIIAIVQSTINSFSSERNNEKIQDAIVNINYLVANVSNSVDELRSSTTEIANKQDFFSQELRGLNVSYQERASSAVEIGTGVSDAESDESKAFAENLYRSTLFETIVSNGSPRVMVVLYLLISAARRANVATGQSVQIDFSNLSDLALEHSVNSVLTTLNATNALDVFYMLPKVVIQYNDFYEYIIDNEMIVRSDGQRAAIIEQIFEQLTPVSETAVAINRL